MTTEAVIPALQIYPGVTIEGIMTEIKRLGIEHYSRYPVVTTKGIEGYYTKSQLHWKVKEANNEENIGEFPM